MGLLTATALEAATSGEVTRFKDAPHFASWFGLTPKESSSGLTRRLGRDRGLVVVRQGKGKKDRVVMLPASVQPALRQQLVRTHALWSRDRAALRPGVGLPEGLARKYPRAGETWAWFWAFPSDHEAVDPRSGERRRHHVFEQGMQRAIKRAVAQAGIAKPVGAHTLRTRSPPICWSAGRTSAPSRNCSATVTWTPR